MSGRCIPGRCYKGERGDIIVSSSCMYLAQHRGIENLELPFCFGILAYINTVCLYLCLQTNVFHGVRTHHNALRFFFFFTERGA